MKTFRMANIKNQLATSCFALIGFLGCSNTTHAGELIYPPQEINCDTHSSCTGVDQSIFKIATLPRFVGTFIFDYAYAAPVISGKNYVIVYVYHQFNSPSIGKVLETWIKDDPRTIPYHPGSSWSDNPDSMGYFHCKGNTSQCGFSYEKQSQ